MRIFHNKTVDLLARRLVPGIAVAAVAGGGILYGGPELQNIPGLMPEAQAVELTLQDGSAAAQNYKDGTYTGTAKGYGGDITVEVTISGGKITAIDIVSAPAETPSFLTRAKGVIDKILEKQSPDVDVVSGATYSSNGILNAVRRALAQAGGVGMEVSDETSGSSAASGGGSTSSDSFEVPSSYKDGTYTGTAKGFGGNITVKVTISGGKITAIDIVSASAETPSYLAKAKGVVAKVLSAQSPNVDVVSGATYSSNGILNAIKRALTSAGGAASSSDDNAGDGSGGSGSDKKPATPDSYTDPTAYKDGTYTGSAEGFGGDISVKVTVSGGKITAIDIVSAAEETPSYLEKAKGVISSILSAQSPNVDAVSGATYSSNGILNAVKRALSNAATTVDPSPAPTPEPDDEPMKTETYHATVSCVPDEDEDFEAYDMTVVITVQEKDGVRSICSIAVSNMDDVQKSNKRYIEKAVDSLSSQTAGVQSVGELDAVSGATCSSNAVIEAIQQLKDKMNLGAVSEEPT